MENKTEIRGIGDRHHLGILSVFLKIVGLCLIAFSIGYWAKIVGIPNSQASFSTMPGSWQAAISALVILQPIAALGLWGNTRWGVVVWILVILIELSVYFFQPLMLSRPQMLLTFHASSFAFYLIIMALLTYGQARLGSASD